MSLKDPLSILLGDTRPFVLDGKEIPTLSTFKVQSDPSVVRMPNSVGHEVIQTLLDQKRVDRHDLILVTMGSDDDRMLGSKLDGMALQYGVEDLSNLGRLNLRLQATEIYPENLSETFDISIDCSDGGLGLIELQDHLVLRHPLQIPGQIANDSADGEERVPQLVGEAQKEFVTSGGQFRFLFIEGSVGVYQPGTEKAHHIGEGQLGQVRGCAPNRKGSRGLT